ncbi:MAG: hypothetical protein AAGN66_14330 [Acidobacteriota bacterium]
MSAHPQSHRDPAEARRPNRRALLLLMMTLVGLATAAAAQKEDPYGGSIHQEEGHQASVGRVEERTLLVSRVGKHVRHLVFTPSAYNADGEETWPLIVGLHGTAGNPEQVMGFQRLRELAERYGYLLACPHSSGVGELPQRYVLRVLADTEERYRVDPERIFLLGFSRGGAGVWALGADHADRWAGLAPISPATGGDPAPLERMRDLPIIVVLGDRDKAVSGGAVRRWVRRMGQLDMRHQFVELPGLGHDLSRVNFLPLVFEFFEGVQRSPG